MGRPRNAGDATIAFRLAFISVTTVGFPGIKRRSGIAAATAREHVATTAHRTVLGKHLGIGEILTGNLEVRLSRTD